LDGEKTVVIDRAEILRLANEFGLEARIVEKDYLLGWVLAGIYRDPLLAGTWIFKGGTCLKKCFLETYRFSPRIWILLSLMQHNWTQLSWKHGSWNLVIGSTKLLVSSFPPTSAGSKSMTTTVAADAARAGSGIAVR
jgi:hypothetical protein